jgi:hypothetical protein
MDSSQYESDDYLKTFEKETDQEWIKFYDFINNKPPP